MYHICVLLYVYIYICIADSIPIGSKFDRQSDEPLNFGGQLILDASLWFCYRPLENWKGPIAQLLGLHLRLAVLHRRPRNCSTWGMVDSSSLMDLQGPEVTGWHQGGKPWEFQGLLGPMARKPLSWFDSSVSSTARTCRKVLDPDGILTECQVLCIAFWVQGRCHRVFSGTAKSPTAATTHQQVMLGQGYGAHYLADGSSYHGEWVCDLDIVELRTEVSAASAPFWMFKRVGSSCVDWYFNDMSEYNIEYNLSNFICSTTLDAWISSDWATKFVGQWVSRQWVSPFWKVPKMGRGFPLS